MFTTSAQVATLTSDVREKRGAAVATGSVNVFVTDFGVVLEMVANRMQQVTAAGVSSLFVIDPEYAAVSYLMAMNAFSLAKTGLADKGMCAADWTLKVMSEEAHGVIRGIDEALGPVALRCRRNGARGRNLVPVPAGRGGRGRSAPPASRREEAARWCA